MSFGNKKILLTGGTGLIGKEIILPLQHLGFDIYAVTRSNKNPDIGVNWLNGSLFDLNFINEAMSSIKPQYLLNLAWQTTGDYLSSDTNYDFLCAGINLIKLFAQNGGQRAVYAGTCFEYLFNDKPLNESGKLDPNKTVYTFCKNKLHEIAKYYSHKNHISFAYARIFYVFGHEEDRTRLAGMLLENLSQNKEVIINCGELLKDYMYSKDIASAFAQLVVSNLEGSINICSGKVISIKEFATVFAKLLGKEHLLKFENNKSDQPKIILGNNERLLKELKFVPKYTLETGLQNIIDEYLKRTVTCQ